MWGAGGRARAGILGVNGVMVGSEMLPWRDRCARGSDGHFAYNVFPAKHSRMGWIWIGRSELSSAWGTPFSRLVPLDVAYDFAMT